MLELLFLSGVAFGGVLGTAGVPMAPVDAGLDPLVLPDDVEVPATTPSVDMATTEVPSFGGEENTGQFTTAEEVRPILSQTKDQWVSLRDFNGQDLLYFTQLDSWRCGLSEVRVSVNGGPLDLREMEPCYTDAATPNEMRGDVLPYQTYGSGEVQQVAVQIVYDDGTSDVAVFSRPQIEE